MLDDIHRRRPHERRQRPLRQRIPILDRPRRFAVRQPPLRGARQRQRLLALVVRVVELRYIDPLRRLARQERQRAARRRVYRARAVNNASSIPRLSRDCPLYVFPPESLHRRHEPTPSGQRSSARRDPLSSFRRMLLAGLQDAVQSGKWPLCCLAATAYGISTASGETDRHRRVRTAGRRRRTGHLVDLEQSRGPSAGQPKPHWTECVGSAGLPLVWGSKERDARDAEARRLRVEGLSFREIWIVQVRQRRARVSGASVEGGLRERRQRRRVRLREAGRQRERVAGRSSGR